jgi:hypothetical protein
VSPPPSKDGITQIVTTSDNKTWLVPAGESKSAFHLDNEINASNVDYVVESRTGMAGIGYVDGWYRKYKSGWVEQGGVSTVGGNRQVTLFRPMEQGPPSVSLTVLSSAITTSPPTTSLSIRNGTETGFEILSTHGSWVSWTAIGQGA